MKCSTTARSGFPPRRPGIIQTDQLFNGVELGVKNFLALRSQRPLVPKIKRKCKPACHSSLCRRETHQAWLCLYRIGPRKHLRQLVTTLFAENISPLEPVAAGPPPSSCYATPGYQKSAIPGRSHLLLVSISCLSLVLHSIYVLVQDLEAHLLDVGRPLWWCGDGKLQHLCRLPL